MKNSILRSSKSLLSEILFEIFLMPGMLQFMIKFLMSWFSYLFIAVIGETCFCATLKILKYMNTNISCMSRNRISVYFIIKQMVFLLQFSDHHVVLQRVSYCHLEAGLKPKEMNSCQLTLRILPSVQNNILLILNIYKFFRTILLNSSWFFDHWRWFLYVASKTWKRKT